MLHTHTLNGVAVSAQKDGVLPISQQSIFVLASLAYHDYEGVALSDDEKPRLVRRPRRQDFLMLRNHGLLTVGRDHRRRLPAHVLLRGRVQHPVRAQGGGELIPIDPRIIDGAAQAGAAR